MKKGRTLVIIATVLMAILTLAGAISLLVTPKTVPAKYTLNERFSGQIVDCEFLLEDEHRFSFSITSKYSSQIRISKSGEYLIEKNVLKIKEDGEENFVDFGVINKLRVEIPNLTYSEAGIFINKPLTLSRTSAIKERKALIGITCGGGILTISGLGVLLYMSLNSDKLKSESEKPQEENKALLSAEENKESAEKKEKTEAKN